MKKNYKWAILTKTAYCTRNVDFCCKDGLFWIGMHVTSEAFECAIRWVRRGMNKNVFVSYIVFKMNAKTHYEDI